MMGVTTGYIGVDLDGTLAHYENKPWDGTSIGSPIPRMVTRVRRLLNEGYEVRIITARVSPNTHSPEEIEEQTKLIQEWCYEHIGRILPVQGGKDYSMLALYDDRAIQVAQNTGEILGLDFLLGN